MHYKIRKIVDELKENISKKYNLKELRVFGSSARGDRKKDSDIDVFVCLSNVNRKIEEDLFDIAYELELKYDCIIDLFVFDQSVYEGVNSYIPVCRNILKEGVSI